MSERCTALQQTTFFPISSSTPSLPMHRCLLFPFVTTPMPSSSSCDNTGTGDLKRYTVKHEPVTHAAAQTLPLTRLALCQQLLTSATQIHESALFTWSRVQSDDLTQTDWLCPRCAQNSVFTHTLSFFNYFFFPLCMKAVLRRCGPACSCPFSLPLLLLSKGPL